MPFLVGSYAFAGRKDEGDSRRQASGGVKARIERCFRCAIMNCYLALIYARVGGKRSCVFPLMERLLKTPGAVDSVDYSSTINRFEISLGMGPDSQRSAVSKADRTTTPVNPKNFLCRAEAEKSLQCLRSPYAIVGWLLIQIATQVFPPFEIPNWAERLVILALIIGFPIALISRVAVRFHATRNHSNRRAVFPGPGRNPRRRRTRPRNRSPFLPFKDCEPGKGPRLLQRGNCRGVLGALAKVDGFAGGGTALFVLVHGQGSRVSAEIAGKLQRRACARGVAFGAMAIECALRRS